jgi:hypothetical protein
MRLVCNTSSKAAKKAVQHLRHPRSHNTTRAEPSTLWLAADLTCRAQECQLGATHHTHQPHVLTKQQLLQDFRLLRKLTAHTLTHSRQAAVSLVLVAAVHSIPEASTRSSSPPVLAHFALEVCIAAVLLLAPLLEAQPVHVLAAGSTTTTQHQWCMQHARVQVMCV